MNQQDDSANEDARDALDPDVNPERAGAVAGSNLFDSSELASALAPTWQPAIEMINASIRSATMPLQEQVAAIIGRSLVQNMQDALQPFFDALPRLTNLTRGVWPANLSGTHVDFDVDTLKMLMLDEALPVAWVPGSETIGRVFAAESPATRRAVYGRRWQSVVSDCEQMTDKMDSAATTRYVRFLRATIRSLREGHPEAAQALAATTLGTAVTEFLDRDTYTQWIRTKARIEPDELSVRRFFIICQLWGIHRQFQARDGDPVPGTFNRHGSVHAVSARQYSRLNAVLGIAHLTSFLWAIDSTYGSRGRP